MRKQLIASLSACLVVSSFAGCGDKSEEAKVSEKLDTLLSQMSRLEYADAPIEGNKLEYTLGKEVDGVQIPGSTRFEAAYIDQALALLPLAQDIKANGSDLQQQSANVIIASIRTDEAAFLIDAAERAFQESASKIISLRSKVSVLRAIDALNNAVAGDRSEIIETYRTGLSADGATVVGINGLEEQASAAASAAQEARQNLASVNEQISELREKVTEYEALELKLTGESRTAQSQAKFDKLEQATTAARESQLAAAQAQKLEIDAWISEHMAELAELKRQRLAGNTEATEAQLLGKLDGFLEEASQETNIPPSSDTYAGLALRLATAKSGAGDDVLKAAAFLLELSEYGTSPAVDGDERKRLVAAMDKRISDYLGVIGVLEMKIAQIKLDQMRVADKLAEIERDRQAVLNALTEAFNKQDTLIQVAGFDRMAAAVDSLKQAEEALKGAGPGNEMELMSVYTLHARALQQQHISSRSYLTTLSSIATAGPDILGPALHADLTERIQGLEELRASVAAAAAKLQDAVGDTPQVILSSVDEESPSGQIAMRQSEVYESLIESIGNGSSGAAPDSSEDDDTETP